VDKEEMDEEEVKGKEISIMALILPLLQYHERVDEIPITRQCTFNCRGLHTARFTCLDLQDNILHSLRNEQKNTPSSVLGGDVVVAITTFCQSFETDKNEGDSLPMNTSVASLSCPETANVHAIALTMDILRGAILWLSGQAVLDSNRFLTVQDGLEIYLAQLTQKFP
jgi:hypothetical protein